MIERIVLENFRGIKRLELIDLKPITLISGKNNAGKSSVLEGYSFFLTILHLNRSQRLIDFAALYLLRIPQVYGRPLSTK